MSGLTVAVTGPTGEIGRPLMAALEAEPAVERVRGMSRRVPEAAGKTEYLAGDITIREDVERLVAGADVVVHLAYLKFGDPGTAREVNLEGSRGVFEAAIAAGAKRIVYTSSVAAYGFEGYDDLPLTEATEPAGSEKMLYSAQKAELERTLARAVAGGDVAAYVMRPCIVAGPDSIDLVTKLPYVRLAGALPGALRSAASRSPAPPVLPDFGTRMQLVHGADLADALLAAVLRKAPAGSYNLAGPGELTAADLAAALGWRSLRLPGPALAAFAEIATRVPRAGARLDWLHAFRAEVLVDSSKARRELGWRPRYDAAETLRQTVAEARRRGVITNPAGRGSERMEVRST